MKSIPDECWNTPLKGGSEVRPAEGHPSLTSLLILVTYSAKHAQLCVKEIHELSVSMWFFFFFFYPILFNSLQKHTFISNMCFFNTLCVKRIDCDCADKWCFQLCVRLVEHKFSELNLCLLWVGSDGLLALISISPPLMKPRHAGCRETFIEVDTTRQRWRSVLRTVAFCVL